MLNCKNKFKPKKKKVLLSLNKKVPKQYGKYSGIVDENGKRVDNPTEGQTMKTMVEYMKNNRSDQSDNPSNVYRPEFQPSSVNYKKKPNTKA
mgnify:CR=1 FL=1